MMDHPFIINSVQPPKDNMGGGLPSIGFWEMKQDIYETLRT